MKAMQPFTRQGRESHAGPQCHIEEWNLGLKWGRRHLTTTAEADGFPLRQATQHVSAVGYHHLVEFRTQCQQLPDMRRTPALFFAASRCARLTASRRLSSEPIVKITNGTFYRQHPASKPSPGQDAPPNPPLFPDLTLSLPSFATPNQHWAILSPSSTIRTAFLQILRGQLLCFPPTARTFPYLLSQAITEEKSRLRYPDRAIEYVGFDVERKAFGGAYLSARYESLKEETDFTVQRYLTGIVTMNPGEEELKAKSIDEAVMRKVMRDLELERFVDKPVNMLSNGQSRRARIAKALLSGPEVLCLDAPFSKYHYCGVSKCWLIKLQSVWIPLSQSIFRMFCIDLRKRMPQGLCFH